VVEVTEDRTAARVRGCAHPDRCGLDGTSCCHPDCRFSADSGITYREFAEHYAGMKLDGTERSPLWDKLVPKRELDLAAEGRRLGFKLMRGGRDADA
jgi:hypothetical protein